MLLEATKKLLLIDAERFLIESPEQVEQVCAFNGLLQPQVAFRIIRFVNLIFLIDFYLTLSSITFRDDARKLIARVWEKMIKKKLNSANNKYAASPLSNKCTNSTV